MRWNQQLFRHASAMLIVAGNLAAEPLSAPDPLIFTVRIVNWAGAPSADIERAAEIAERAFQRAGFRSRWIDCTPDRLGFFETRECQTRGSTTDFRLSIRLDAPPNTRPGVLGIATYPEQGFPDTAWVILSRAQTLAVTTSTPLEIVLGYIFAHEVGHLLLEHDSHSRKGIMRARWSQKDFVRASRGALTFSASQTKRMISRIRERTEAGQSDSPYLLLSQRTDSAK